MPLEGQSDLLRKFHVLSHSRISHRKMRRTPNPVLTNPTPSAFIYPVVYRNIHPRVFTVLMDLSVSVTPSLLPHVSGPFSILLSTFEFLHSHAVYVSYDSLHTMSPSVTNFSHTHPVNISHDKHFTPPHPARSLSHAGLSLFRLMSANRNKYGTTFNSLDGK